jgi:hypothetical protein
MTPIHCCTLMDRELGQTCAEHDPQDCPDIVIRKYSGWYGMPIKDGGSGAKMITYCPFCGTKL